MSEPGSAATPRGASRTEARILRLDRVTPAALDAYFEESWELYERLFSSIVDDRAFYEEADPLRHPLVFYLAHPAAFYVNKLRIVGLREGPVNVTFDDLFVRGVDPESPAELPRRLDWPSVDALVTYRDAVRHLVRDVIARLTPRDRVGPEDPEWAILMGIEHERIHLETSSVLIRQLSTRSLRPPEGFAPADVAGRGAPSGFVDVPSREVTLGKPPASTTYGWDNEYGEKRARVRSFRAGTNLVTNREYLSFVEDAGYARSELWSPEGWRWRTASRARMPRFWLLTEDGLRYRSTFEVLHFPADWPVEVCQHEAEAYCRWLGDGFRLPTELEWARMVELVGPRGVEEDGPAFNLHLRFGSPTPVGTAEGRERGAVNDVRGNVWQWLTDDFAPLPGFSPHLLYPDFSVPFFGRAHATLRGGSWATTGASASPWYRLWFRRYFYQHAGFRVVRALP